MKQKKSIRHRLWTAAKWTLAAFALLLAALAAYLYSVAVMEPPPPPPGSGALLSQQRAEINPHCFTLGKNWLRRSDSGLWELYVEGEPFERGVVNGKLTRELVVRQEDAFSEQINRLVPSGAYRHFLKYFIAWFNRRLDENVTEECKQEIHGVSLSASDAYAHIGSNYQRLMNYHAAHDIGHALQNMALVGCTSFAAWGGRSADSSLVIARNFDFFVGDKFAEDKIVAFVSPAQGHKFMTVTWGGMTGVVSGMNDQGLTVTLNAAKSDVPSGAATPISLVGREILQYAQTIEEALAIARKRKTFVSESLLIGSAQDGRAAVIEKTPEQTALYEPQQEWLVCANHYQSEVLAKQENNLVQMAESASPYRFRRVWELLERGGKMDLPGAVALLRDQRGLNDADLGMGNEKVVNQLLAHHAIVFQPEKLLVSVSTAPWQLGRFVTYDLRKVFAMNGLTADVEIRETALDIAPDTFLNTAACRDYLSFRQEKERLRKGKGDEAAVEAFVRLNPAYYYAHVVAGDWFFEKKQFEKALERYQSAQAREIATLPEARHVAQQVEKCKKRLKK